MTCTVDGCGKRLLARGFCSAHYSKWRKYGDPTVVKMAAHGEPMEWILAHLKYEGDDCIAWPFGRYKNGYGVIGYEGHNTGAHRLMCRLARGEPPSDVHEAAHSCGRGSSGCCNPNHLRWATPSENSAERRVHGTSGTGSSNACAKLTESDIPEIRALAGAVSITKIAERFGVSRGAVRLVLAGATWTHVA
jgi:hypothetical protein